MYRKLRNYAILSLLFMETVVFQGCNSSVNCIRGEGPIVTQEIDLDTFDNFTFEVAGNVTVVEDSVQKITVTTNENVLVNLNTTVQNNTWNINFNSCVNRYDRFEVVIHTPNLEGVVLSGSGSIQSSNTLHTSDMMVLLNGSGSVNFDLETPNLSTTISGSGNVTLGGSATNHSIAIPGSGNVQAFNMENKDCDINISGSGSCDVSVVDALIVTISGSGSVRYQGDPTVSSTITGSGSVVKVD